jgi:hypothetical protein
MKTLRALGFFSVLLLCGGAYAQSTVRWVMNEGPSSVLVQTWSFGPFTTRLVNVADDTPAVGVPFLYRTEPHCGSFAEGFEMTGVSDENGHAVSSLFLGVQQDLGCKVSFYAQGMDNGFGRTVNVFHPDNVTLTLERPSWDTTVNRAFEVWVFHTLWNEYVNAGPPEVIAGVGGSGATATLVGASCPIMNSGLCIMQFVANDRPGPYTIEFRYAQSTATVQIRQRRN